MKKKSKKWIGCLALTLIAFVFLITIENHFLKQSEKQKVLVAKTNIEKGKIIEEKNYEEYFEEQKREKTSLPEGVIVKEDCPEQMQFCCNVVANQVILPAVMTNEEQKEYDNPVEVSIKVDDLSQMVGGTLREGDYIDVSIVEESSNKNELVIENHMVTKAIYADGTWIEKEDQQKSALVINMIVDKEEENILNEAIGLGKIRICKRMDK